MNILLVNPPIPGYFYNREFYFPSSLLYLAGTLRQQGHSLRIVDFKTYQRQSTDPPFSFYEQRLSLVVEDFKPDLIGFGSLFSGNFPDVLRLAQHCKERFPDIPNVIGGIHPTLYAPEILANCSCIDTIVMGEGEDTVVQMTEAMQSGGDFSGIDGFAFRRDGDIVVNPKTGYLPDVDQLPLPAYDLIHMEDYYMDTSCWHNPKGLPINTSVPIISSRSCPNRCSFCSMYQVMGPAWRPRSASNVLDEIELVYDQYGQRHFSFMDDNVTLSKSRIMAICQGIVERGMDLQFETPNGISIKTIDADVLDAMVNAGLVRTSLAIESGSEFIRNRVMKKRLSDEKIYEVIELTRQYPQLFVSTFFLIGMPEETQETLAATYGMIQRIDTHKTIVMNLVPFPGTEVFAQAVKDELLVGVDQDKLYLADNRYFTNYDQIFLKPYALELDDIREFREKCNALLQEQQSTQMKV
jgi:anaerobic magnesium-protoporphyrin IX monomethyl ester cyclase